MSNVDALDALQKANPRHQEGFDRGVAAIAGHTQEALAAAGGVATGSVPSALKRIGAGHYRRGRGLLSVLVATSVVALTVVVVIRGTTSVPRSHPPQASPRVGSSLPGSASGSGPVGPANPSTVPTTAPAATLGPAALPPVASPGPTNPPGLTNPTGATGATAATVPAAPTTRPPTDTTGPSSTTAAPPPTTVASAVPTCAASALRPGPPQQREVQVQDVGSGLASISNVTIINGTVDVPNFAPGTTAIVVVVAIKADPTKATEWSFDATDVAGHTTHCG